MHRNKKLPVLVASDVLGRRGVVFWWLSLCVGLFAGWFPAKDGCSDEALHFFHIAYSVVCFSTGFVKSYDCFPCASSAQYANTNPSLSGTAGFDAHLPFLTISSFHI